MKSDTSNIYQSKLQIERLNRSILDGIHKVNVLCIVFEFQSMQAVTQRESR